jgi:hypothetical protein
VAVARQFGNDLPLPSNVLLPERHVFLGLL